MLLALLVDAARLELGLGRVWIGGAMACCSISAKKESLRVGACCTGLRAFWIAAGAPGPAGGPCGESAGRGLLGNGIPSNLFWGDPRRLSPGAGVIACCTGLGASKDAGGGSSASSGGGGGLPGGGGGGVCRGRLPGGGGGGPLLPPHHYGGQWSPAGGLWKLVFDHWTRSRRRRYQS